MSMSRGFGPIVKCLVVSLAVGLPSQAWAQVAPPPPPVVAKPAKLKPPPPRPPRPPAPPPSAHAKPRPKAPVQVQVPNIPYEPMVKFDDKGKLIRLDGQLDLIALKHNPTIGPKTIERIRPALEDWKQRVDVMVVDNLDIMQDVDNGLFEKMDLKDEDQKVLLNEVFKMIISTSGPNNILANGGSLTPTQLNFQRRLVGDYTDALNKEVSEDIKARIPDDAPDAKNQQVLEVSRFSLSNMSRDEVMAFREMLVTAADFVDPALASLSLGTEEQGPIAEPLKAVKAAKTDQDKTGAIKALLASMSMTRQRDFMKAVLAARGPAKLPQLDDAAIKPNGLPPVEDIDEAKTDGAAPDAK